MSDSTENTSSVVIERVYRHSPEKLWRALTESPLLAQWLMKNDFEPATGKKFEFRAEPVANWDGLIHCEVLIVEPLKQLSYTWASMGMTSVVLWTLTSEDGGTHLRMEHSGFRPDQQQAYGGAKYGWQKFLDNLERTLSGAAL